MDYMERFVMSKYKDVRETTAITGANTRTFVGHKDEKRYHLVVTPTRDAGSNELYRINESPTNETG